MQISVIYDSKTGNTQKAANFIVAGIAQVDGVSARAFHIDDVDEAYVKASDGVIVGTPTYSCSVTSDLKAWLEKRLSKLDVAGKLGGAFSTAAFIHGGAEIALQTILTHMMVAGMMVYSSGASQGLPIIHLGPVAIEAALDDFADLFTLYGKRFAEQVKKIAG